MILQYRTAQPEPNSRFGQLNPDRVKRISSSAERILVRELIAYSRGATNGRSMLIGGDRGAGKTSLVYSAMLQAGIELAKLESEPDIHWDKRVDQPLLVLLHGPSLFPASVSSNGSSTCEPTPEDVKLALHEMTLALYWVVADLCTKFIRERTVSTWEELANWKRNRGRNAICFPEVEAWTNRAQAGRELVAQMELDLNRFDDRGTLAALWQRSRRSWQEAKETWEAEKEASETGEGKNARQKSKNLARWWNRKEVNSDGKAGRDTPVDQTQATAARLDGLFDSRHLSRDTDLLSAFLGVCEAAKRIVGERKLKLKASNGNLHESKVSVESNASFKDLTNVLWALVAGGIAALGTKAAFAAGNSSSWLAGLLTGTTTLVAFSFSQSWSTKREQNFEQSFEPFTGWESVISLLPRLVGQLRQAGYAPIFVVDELDKVENIDQRLGSLTPYLKKLTAEQTFFCFLCGREYFHRVQQKTGGGIKDRESTFYTHRLFVYYRPEDFHDYLKGFFYPPSPSQAPDEPVIDNFELQDLTEIQKSFLERYLLLFAAELHPIELHRELARRRRTVLAEQEGKAEKVSADVVDFNVSRIELGAVLISEFCFQAAIEYVLSRPEVVRQVEQDPDFLQLASDALYFAVRLWEQGSPIDLSASGVTRAEFERYLLVRVTNRRDLSEEILKTGLSPFLSSTQIHMLWQVFHLLTYCLCVDPEEEGALPSRLSASQIDPQVVKDWRIKTAAQEPAFHSLLIKGPPPLLLCDEMGVRFHWGRDRTGFSAADESPALQAVAPASDWTQHQAYLNKIESQLEALPGYKFSLRKFAEEPGLPLDADNYARMNKALAELPGLDPQHPDALLHRQALAQFVAELQAELENLGTVLASTYGLVLAAGKPCNENSLPGALRAVSRLLSKQPKEGLDSRMLVTLRLMDGIAGIVGGDLQSRFMKWIKRTDVPLHYWYGRLSSLPRELPQAEGDAARQRAVDQAWDASFLIGSDSLFGPSSSGALAALTISKLNDRGPGAFLEFEASSLSCRQLSRLAVSALTGLDPGSDDGVFQGRRWGFIPALWLLGFPFEPEWDRRKWSEIASKLGFHGSDTRLPFTFAELSRVKPRGDSIRVLLLTADDSQVANEWFRSPDGPMLPLVWEAREAERFVSFIRQHDREEWLLRCFQFDVLVLDENLSLGERDSLRGSLTRFVKPRRGYVPTIAMMAENAASESRADPSSRAAFPGIKAPHNLQSFLDDVARVLRAGTDGKTSKPEVSQ